MGAGSDDLRGSTAAVISSRTAGNVDLRAHVGTGLVRMITSPVSPIGLWTVEVARCHGKRSARPVSRGRAAPKGPRRFRGNQRTIRLGALSAQRSTQGPTQGGRMGLR